MVIRFIKLSRTALLAGLGAGLIASAATAWAEAGPFAGYSGSWSGAGAISLTSGAVERLHCTAAYRVDAGARRSCSTSIARATAIRSICRTRLTRPEATSAAAGSRSRAARGGNDHRSARRRPHRRRRDRPRLHGHLCAARTRKSTADRDQSAGWRHYRNLRRARPSPSRLRSPEQRAIGGGDHGKLFRSGGMPAASRRCQGAGRHGRHFRQRCSNRATSAITQR